MHIFVDESGSFTHSPDLNAWCVVAAYVTPEHERRRIDGLMATVRALNDQAETKLKHLTEDQYLWFLSELNKLSGAAFAVAVDVGRHRPEAIEHHRDMQADKIIEHRDKMLHETGRKAVTALSEQIRSLPAQLYTQLMCQVRLFHQIISQGTFYFVQRHPPSLANFRWRLDQKARVPTAYEEAFRILLPAILQTKSLQEPMLALKGADYRHFGRFEYAPGEAPTYLKDVYGIEIEGGLNIGKMIGEDFQLVDSAATPGVQVADLVAAGVRRLLRGGFTAEERVASALGACFVQPFRGKTAVQLVSLDLTGTVDEKPARLIHRMNAAARPMIAR